MKAIRNRKNIGIKRCIFATTIAAALMVPAQAIAISCGASAAGSVLTSDPIFLGQEVTLRASIGASVIDGGTEITIPEWSYFPDCGASENWFTCTDQLNDVEFLQVLSTNCVDDQGGAIFWKPTESVEVTFDAFSDDTFTTPSAAAVPAGSTCFTDFKVRVNTIDPDTFPKLIFGALGFNSASCDTTPPLTGQASGSVAYALESCAIDIIKEVDVGTGWLDANDPDGPNLEVGGNAEYRLTVENTGTAPFVAPPGVSIFDGPLGIDENIGGMTPGEVVILTSGDIAERERTNKGMRHQSKE